MRRLITAATVLAAAATLIPLDPLTIEARPNRYNHSDREERHMLPSVSSGYTARAPNSLFSRSYSETPAVFCRCTKKKRRGSAQRVGARVPADTAEA